MATAKFDGCDTITIPAGGNPIWIKAGEAAAQCCRASCRTGGRVARPVGASAQGREDEGGEVPEEGRLLQPGGGEEEGTVGTTPRLLPASSAWGGVAGMEDER